MKYPTLIDFFFEEFEKAGIRYVLIGGFAINSYGITRDTLDIDFLTCRVDYDKIVGVLKKEGYREYQLTETFARLESKEPKLMNLDFIFVDLDILTRMLQEARTITMVGKKFKVPSLNHMIALKLHAVKHNLENRWFKDVPDLVQLIRKNGVEMRSREMKDLFLSYGTKKLYDKVLAGCEGRVP